MGLAVYPVRWVEGSEHPCSPTCWAALSKECRCSCKGAKHGVAMLPAGPVSKDELDALYERLVSTSPLRKGTIPPGLMGTSVTDYARKKGPR